MDFCARMTGHLLLEVIKKGSHKNLVVSPLSFSVVLNMIAAGSTGSTLRQMAEFLGWKNTDDTHCLLQLMNIASSSSSPDDVENNNRSGDPIICLANGVWVDKQYRLKASYQEFVYNVCKAQAKNVDFVNQADKVVEEANAWAKSETKGLVRDILKVEYITRDTKLLLGNALYFKGSWKGKFIAQATKHKDFYLLNGGKVSVPFMTGCRTYTSGSSDGFQVVKIPYQEGKDGEAFSMFIFLPNEIDGLQKLLEKANCDPGFFRQNFWLVNRRFDHFWIPKFKFNYGTTKGCKTMMDMGLKLPFKENCKELNGLIDTQEVPFFISGIIQQAFIEVDEVGTEAAAVTFGLADGCSRYYEPTRFVADHPFMFMIREDRSRTVLFTGAVLNPLLH